MRQMSESEEDRVDLLIPLAFPIGQRRVHFRRIIHAIATRGIILPRSSHAS